MQLTDRFASLVHISKLRLSYKEYKNIMQTLGYSDVELETLDSWYKNNKDYLEEGLLKCIDSGQ